MGYTAYAPVRGEENLWSLKFESRPWNMESFQVMINNEVCGEVVVCILVAGWVQGRICHGALCSQEWESTIVCLCVQQKWSTGTFVSSFWLRCSWCSQQHLIPVTFQTGMISTAVSSFKGASLIRRVIPSQSPAYLLEQNRKGLWGGKKKLLWGLSSVAHEHFSLLIEKKHLSMLPFIVSRQYQFSNFLISTSSLSKMWKSFAFSQDAKKIHELVGIRRWYTWSGTIKKDHQFKLLMLQQVKYRGIWIQTRKVGDS